MAEIRLNDVTVATIMPFDHQGEIDWASYRRSLDYCATPEGVQAVFVNGHAGEGAALTPEERRRVIQETRRHLGAERTLLSGVIAQSTREAIAQAREAREAGADVAVLFPIPQMAAGGTRNAAVPLAYVEAVAGAVDMPLSIFQFPLGSGLGYTTDTLVELARMPSVLAIKEGSDTMLAYEDNWRAIKAARPECLVLPSNFDWFLAQVAIGADGILSGLATLTPHFLAELWRASEAQDLAAMRRASDKLYPIVRSIYGRPPRMDMHTRIKVGLQHLGVIANARPRGPLLPVSDDIAADVVRAVEQSGLPGLVGKAA